MREEFNVIAADSTKGYTLHALLHSTNYKGGIGSRIGACIILFWSLVAIFGPVLAPFDQGASVADFPFAAGDGLLLGSDYLGRDLFSRILWGARNTIGLSLFATLLAYAIGVTLGMCAAVLGGLIDSILSRINDILLSLPNIMLALLTIAALGTSNLIVVFTTAIVFSSSIFRLSRALGQDVMVQDYVEAAQVRGEKLAWIVFREVLPNVAIPLVTDFGVRFVFVMLFISGLSFLGLGAQPPASDWGAMIRENIQGLSYGEYAALWPATAIASLTLAINLIVDDFSALKGGELTRQMG